jgi:hypothetical protein
MTTIDFVPVLARASGLRAPQSAQEFSSSLDRCVWIACLKWIKIAPQKYKKND